MDMEDVMKPAFTVLHRKSVAYDEVLVHWNSAKQLMSENCTNGRIKHIALLEEGDESEALFMIFGFRFSFRFWFFDSSGLIEVGVIRKSDETGLYQRTLLQTVVFDRHGNLLDGYGGWHMSEFRDLYFEIVAKCLDMVDATYRSERAPRQ
jgi:hypothetical protein